MLEHKSPTSNLSGANRCDYKMRSLTALISQMMWLRSPDKRFRRYWRASVSRLVYIDSNFVKGLATCMTHHLCYQDFYYFFAIKLFTYDNKIMFFYVKIVIRAKYEHVIHMDNTWHPTCNVYCLWLNTQRPSRNEQHFADDIFKRIFFNENV